MLDKSFWKGRKVFLTGHTGFKGSWMCLWLSMLGAEVTGYALNPPTMPSMFELCKIDSLVNSVIGDIRDRELLNTVIQKAEPEIIIHMAAQPLVSESYKNTVETYDINLMGTVNLFEAVKNCKSVKAVINVTTDKCYENKEWVWAYRENEPMGGYDPYSCSKACSELITSSYRLSFFNPENFEKHGVGIASARAGNVIGGGDWADNRLIPDCIRALLEGRKIIIRNPQSIRPWQHVLEPVRGYLLLAQKLFLDGPKYSEAWNFGPENSSAITVEAVVKGICKLWDEKAGYEIESESFGHESKYLKLDCSKAKTYLGWYPKMDINEALLNIVEWSKAYKEGKNLLEVCCRQINRYTKYCN
ncbi:MAG: CDP-glucose 4,6-dehydratase [Clostridia bacterium]|nr:CDP-glucose 4,6-dehydratase [Clostridia bacterium]